MKEDQSVVMEQKQEPQQAETVDQVVDCLDAVEVAVNNALQCVNAAVVVGSLEILKIAVVSGLRDQQIANAVNEAMQG